MRHTIRIVRLLVVFVAVIPVAACSSESPSAPSTSAAASAVLVLDSSNFDAIVLRGDRPWMVEFYSPTCPYCQMMEPIVEQLARDYSGRAMVGKVDVNLEPGLVSAWHIPGWPTFLFFRNGQEVARQVGATSYDQLARMLNSAIGT